MDQKTEFHEQRSLLLVLFPFLLIIKIDCCLKTYNLATVSILSPPPRYSHLSSPQGSHPFYFLFKKRSGLQEMIVKYDKKDTIRQEPSY